MIPLLVFAAPYKPADATERQTQEAVPTLGYCHKNGGRPVSPADDADTCRASCHLESCPAPPNYPFEQSDDTNCGQNRRNHQQYLLLFHSIIIICLPSASVKKASPALYPGNNAPVFPRKCSPRLPWHPLHTGSSPRGAHTPWS